MNWQWLYLLLYYLVLMFFLFVLGFDIGLFAVLFVLVEAVLLITAVVNIMMQEYFIAGLLVVIFILSPLEIIPYCRFRLNNIPSQLSLHLFFVIGIFVISYSISLYILRSYCPGYIAYIIGVFTFILSALFYKVHLKRQP
jgi:hypothetical protein